MHMCSYPVNRKMHMCSAPPQTISRCEVGITRTNYERGYGEIGRAAHRTRFAGMRSRLSAMLFGLRVVPDGYCRVRSRNRDTAPRAATLSEPESFVAR